MSVTPTKLSKKMLENTWKTEGSGGGGAISIAKGEAEDIRSEEGKAQCYEGGAQGSEREAGKDGNGR